MDASSNTRLTYSDGAAWRGLIAAMFAAWFLSIELGFASAELYDALVGTQGFDPYVLIDWISEPGALLLFGYVGFPFTAVVGVLIALPLWAFADGRGQSSYTDAARTGAVGGAIVAGIELGFTGIWFITFLLEGNQPDLGLVLKFVADLACTIGIGAVAGLAARLAAGPPRLPRV
jgi:hypothetical protein